MKVLGTVIALAGFILMMAGVGTIEADNSIVGFELAIWAAVSLIGLLSWACGMLIAGCYHQGN